MTEKRDVFLCHASEDKAAVLEPLVAALQESGISHWYDEAEIGWGDSITEKVNDGLRSSQFVLVVFSEAFINKKWPKRELNAVLNMEASTGEVKVLPLLFGTEEQRTRIRDAYPILNDKTFMTWDQGIPSIVHALKARISGSPPERLRDASPKSPAFEGPIPDMRERYTQRDRNRFLRQGFRVVREYFEAGAAEINRKYPEVELDVDDVHSTKFVCTIYHRGDLVNRCKIWIGGLTSSDAISYAAGTLMDINNDNSFNESLVVADDGAQIGFKATMQYWHSPGGSEFSQMLSPEKAAEYLWLRAIEPLKHRS